MKNKLPMQHALQKKFLLYLKTVMAIFLLSLFVFSGKTYSQNCTVNANVSQNVCVNAPLNLIGTAGGLFQVTPSWSQYSGPSLIINNPTNYTNAQAVGHQAMQQYVFRLSATCQDGSVVWDTSTYRILPITIAQIQSPDLTVCPGINVGTLIGNTPIYPGETVLWSISGTNNGVTINNPTSPTTTISVSGTSSGVTTIRYQIFNPNTCLAIDDFVFISNPGGISPVTAGPDQTLNNCYAATQSTTLTGSYGGSGFLGQQGTWTVVSGPNIPSFGSVNGSTTSVTNLIQGTYVFRWTVAGPCANGVDEVTVIVPAPSASITTSAGSSQVFCDGRTTVLLSGTQPIYINETGLWVQTGGPAATIVSPTNQNTTVNLPVGSGTYTFTWTITNSLTACTSGATHSVTINTNPTITIDAGNNTRVLGCNTTTTTLPWTSTGNGSVSWSIVTGPTTPTYPVIPTTPIGVSASNVTIAGLTVPGDYVIRFYANPGAGSSCATASDDITVTVSRPPTASNAGTAQYLGCNITSAPLAGNAPFVGTGQWSQQSGPSTATIADVNNPTTTVSGLVAGVYLFRWRISGGPMCPANQSRVAIRVATVIPMPVDAGIDQTTCYGYNITLDGTPLEINQTGQWTVVPNLGVSFSDATIHNPVVSGLSPSTVYTFTWTVTNACGTAADDCQITTTSLLGPIQANAGPDFCMPSGTTTFNLNGNNPSPGLGLWTQVSGPAASITFDTAYSTSVTGVINGTYRFAWTITVPGCGSTTDTVTIIVPNGVTPSNAGADQQICGTTVTLAGNTPVVGTGGWSLFNGDAGAIIADTLLPNTTVSNLLPGVYTFRWTIRNGICATSFDDMQVFVSATPSIAAAGVDQQICGVNSTVLAATVPASGNGTWSVISGPNVPTFSNISSATSSISGMISGLYILRWTVSGGPYCPSNFDDMQIRCVMNANAGPDASICTVIDVPLTGTIGSVGTWTLTAGPNIPTITSTGGNTAIVNGMIIGVYTFTYTINFPGCPSTSDDVVITVVGTGTVPNAGPDQDLCNAVSISLNGNVPVIGTGLWTQIFGPGGGSFAPNASTPNATFNGAVPGTYVFVWTITNGACVDADQVRINNYAPPTIANAGVDKDPVCVTFANMTANLPLIGLGQWSQVAGPNIATFTSQIMPNAQAQGLIPGLYTFTWTIANGPICPTSSDNVDVVVYQPPTTPDAGPDVDFCNVSMMNLQGNTITIGTGTWTLVSGPAVTFADVNNPNTLVTFSGRGTHVFRWTSELLPCTLIDQVTVNNYALPTSAFAGIDRQICEYDGLVLTGNTPVNGTGLWSLQSGPTNPVFLNPTGPITQVLGTLPGVYVFKWTISNGPCTPSNDYVTITINQTPSFANAGPNQSFCAGITSTLLAANAPLVGTGVWSQISGPNNAAIANTSLPNTGISNLIIGTYVFRWTISNGACIPSISNVTITVSNCGPTALNDTYVTPEDTPFTGNIITNDSDPDGDVLSVTGFVINGITYPGGSTVVMPGIGTIYINSNGFIQFTPAPNFNGPVPIIPYTISDGNGGTATANIEITVTPLNDVPLVNADHATTPEDTPVTIAVLNNDSDPDGSVMNPLTVDLNQSIPGIQNSYFIPGQGTFTVDAAGVVTFTPVLNFNGTVTPIIYSACDNGIPLPSLCDTAFIYVNVTPVNDPPIANPDLYTTNEDTPITASVIGNDSDVDNNLNPVGYSVVTGPTNGTVNFNSNGTFTYTPDLNFFGTDTFIYMVCDLGLPVYCDTALVTITVNTVNDPPVAVDDIANTPEDTPVSDNILTNDSDPDGDPINVVNFEVNGTTYAAGPGIVTIPGVGTITIGTTGAWTFNPAPNFNGPVPVITYVITDGTANDTATLSIFVGVINDPPTALDDNVVTPEDTPVNGYVLPNDSDPDGDPLVVTSFVVNGITYPAGATVTMPGYGVITLYSNGLFSFVPELNFNGPVPAIPYTISDGNGGIASANLNILVTPVNDPPVFKLPPATTPEDTPVTVCTTISDPDLGDTFTPSLCGAPVNGILTAGPTVVGNQVCFTYLPNPGYNGLDSVCVIICDNAGLCDTSTSIITVLPVNDPPVAINDVNNTLMNVPVSGNVLTNDHDPDGDPITINVTPIVSPANGSVVINTDGSYTYTPTTGFTGVDTFVYEICDNGIPPLCDQATVTITVINPGPNNDPPVAINDAYQGTINLPVNGNVITNDWDPDGNLNTVSVALVGPSPVGLSFILNPNGTFSYVPNSGFVGQVTFDYQICDLGMPIYCDTASATIDILPTPPPVNTTYATDDTYFGPEDLPILGNVLTNDNDPEGDSQIVNTTPVVQPLHGTVVLNANGTFTYTPDAGYNGPDQFVYEVCDDGVPVVCDMATVYLLINAVNDPPVAINDVNNTLMNVPVSGNVLTNDSDPDGDPITINTTPITYPTNGTVSINNDGSYTYTPNTGFTGVDTFVYEICDNGTPPLCDQATATITVINPGPNNDPPVAVNDAYQGSVNLPVNGTVMVNDWDPDGNLNSLSAILVGPAPVGVSFTLNPDGTFTYVPTPGFVGQVTFDYQICDLGMPIFCDLATVTIDIQSNPLNNSTFATDDTYFGPEDLPILGNVLTNDIDPEGNIQTVNTTPVVLPLHGTVLLNADGTFTYTPDAGYNGPDQFVYQVCDNGTPVACDLATVYLLLNAVNDPPIAINDVNNTLMNVPVSGNVLTNDSDPDGNPITINTTPIANPTNGFVTINPDGSYTYTPNTGFIGVDTFVYEICDNGTPPLCDQATATITVINPGPNNDPPVAVNDAYQGSVNLPVNGNVITNDWDPDGNLNPVSVTLVGLSPANGTLTLNPTGTFTFVPNSGFVGQVTFDYQICDLGMPVYCDIATVTIDIEQNPSNNSTFATDDTYFGLEDLPIGGNVLLNDNDPEGNTQTVNPIPVVQPLNGTVVLNANGTFTYTPNTNYNGPDQFVYQVCDNGTPQACDFATVYLLVNGVNDPPVANPDNFTTNEDTPLLGTVIPNDSDLDGNLNPNGFTLISGTTNGVIAFNTDGSFVYTPNANYTGPDSFIYQACDLGMPVYCDTAIVYINVLPVNDPPVVPDTIVTTPEDTPITVCLPISDVDANSIFTASLCGSPTNGTITSGPTVIGNQVCVTYQPNTNFNGADNICITICDNGAPALCDNGTITILVNPGNDPPVAVNDTVTTPEDTPVSGNVLPNDSDLDGDPLTVTSFIVDGVTYPAGATVTITGYGVITLYSNGLFNFTPALNYTGPVPAIPYTISDGNGGAASANIIITVTPVNDPPVVPDQTVTTPEDTPITVCLPITDPDTGSIFTASLCGSPTNGTITSGPTVAGNQVCITYQPNTNFNGTDNVCITICDNGTPVLCDNGNITIIVTPVNDPPIANPDLFSTNEDTPFTATVITNDSDVDNNLNPTGFAIVTGPINGTINFSNNGTFTYTPNLNFFGTDTFIYTVCDLGMPIYCDTALVTITVNSVNDPPVAVDDFATTPEDTPVSGNVLSNDSDPDGDPLTVVNFTINGTTYPVGTTSVLIPGIGNFVMDSTGTWTFTPLPNYNGPVPPITYLITDGNGGTDVAVLNIFVGLVNDPPVAVNDTVTTPEDTPVSGNVLPNDSDIDGDPLTVVSFIVGGVTYPAGATVTMPGYGIITIYANGLFNFTPALNYTGPVPAIPYTITDGNGGLASANLIITVTPVNDPPVVPDLTVTTPEDTPITVCLPITDPDTGSVFTASLCGSPTNGTITSGPTVVGNQVCVTYQPNTNFNGTDNICITICDNGSPVLCDNGNITIIVTPVNDPPIANPDLFSTNEDTPVSGTVINNDSDVDGNLNPTGFSLITPPANGTVVFANNGTFTYTPNANFNGTDTFIYMVCDLGMPIYCDTALVTITVNAVNDPPVVYNENIRLCGSEGNTISVNVLYNGDYDPEGTLVSLDTTYIYGPLNGTATLAAGGLVTYEPNTGYYGTDMIVVQVCDAGIPAPGVCSFDTIFILVDQAVTADAGQDQSFCQDMTFMYLNGNHVPYANVLWTQVSGPIVLITPANMDEAVAIVNNVQGTYTFQYTVTNNTCSASDQVTYTLWNPPTPANAGADQLLCGASSTVIFGNVPTVGTGFWAQVAGPDTATIMYPNTPTALLTGLIPGTYTFSWTITNGQVCDPSIDYVNITITAPTTGTAGPNATICESGTYTLSGASVTNATSVYWATTGTGSFNSSNITNPVYTPSVNDIHDGYVYLILTGNASAPCPNLVDTMTLFISRQAIVNAGPDAIICETQTSYILAGSTSQYAVTYQWTSTGTGGFINGNSLHPTYNPSAADIAAGSVTLTVVATSAAPCQTATDAMVLTIRRQAIVNAGIDATICETGTYTLSTATAQYTTGLQWTSSGTGTFSNATSLNPVYTPSVNDIHDGYVYLTLTGTSASPCVNVSDVMMLTINRQAIVNAGPDVVICETQAPYYIVGSTSMYATGYTWTTSGTGGFTNANTLHPTYNPSVADIAAGSVTLTVVATSAAPCSTATDAMVLTLRRQAIVNAGVDAAICETGTYTLSTATAQFTTGLQWTSSGTGSFSNAGTLNPVYTPSINDIQDGFVYLTLTGTSASPCVTVSDVMVLTINHQAIVNAGPDAVICETQGSYLISGSTSMYAIGYNWTTSGTGTFTNGNTLHPTYNPSAQDITNGSVTLTVVATSAAPCPTATDAMVLTIRRQAIVNAGPNATICETGTYALNGSTAQFATTLSWTTSGTGTFSSSTALHPVYTPSANDIDDGVIYLILTGTSLAPCISDVDTMVLNISLQATNVYAGADAVICETETYTLADATAVNATGLLWTTSGTGTFNANNILNPTYDPSPADILAGSVTLTLTAFSASPCVSVSDAMVLSFSLQAIASAGPDDVVCENASYTLVGATAINAVSIFWTTSGSGTFTDPTILNAVYNPSAADILNGSVTLSIHATSESPCPDAEVDHMLLTISYLPVLYAGADTSICQYDVYYVDDATAEYATYINWTTNGTGTILDGTTINPTYVPGPNEIGTIMLILNGVSSQACLSIVLSDTMYLTIMEPPIANAGLDDSIMWNVSIQLNGTMTNGSGVYYPHWEPASLLVDPNVEDPTTVPLTATTTFVFSVFDLVTGCIDYDTVIITIDGINLAPVAVDDYDTTEFQTCINIPVLTNDYDPEGGVLTITLCGSPANGTVTINSDGTITYCPYDGFQGDDSFCYQICDNGSPVLCDQAIVYIHVNPIVEVEELIIYNAVSPNGDGSNDVWIIENIEFFPDNEATIFNRWGDVIANYTHYNNKDISWDATHKGKRVPDGTYYYVLDIKNKKKFAGWIYVKTGK